MSIDRRPALVRLQRGLCTRLLIFYPPDLRDKFGDEMADVFEAVLSDAVVERGPAGIIAPWRHALWELLTVAAPLRLASTTVMAGAVSLVASSMLVLAFFRAVT